MAGAQTPDKKASLTKADRAAWRKVLKWPQGCEDAFQKTYNFPGAPAPDYGGLDFFDLGQSEHLVKVTCYPGAYQPGFVFVYFNESRPAAARLLKFKRYGRETSGRVIRHYDSEILGFETFDRKTKVLEIFSKSRGPGDCGSLVKYRISRGRPVVIEARAQPCYDDPRRRTGDTRRWQRVKKL